MTDNILKSEFKTPHNLNLLLSIFALVYEIFIFRLLVLNIIAFPIFFLLHFLLVASIMSLIPFYKKKYYYTKELFLAGLETAILFSLGSAISTMVILFNFFRKEKINRVKTFLEEIKKKQSSHIELLTARLDYTEEITEESATPEPFEDIMTYGSIKEKQSALIIAKRYFRPQFLPFILKASEDGDNTIRVLAATIISSVRKSILDQIIKMENQIKTHQENTKLLVEFLDYYKNFILTNFIKYEQLDALLNDFIDSFRKYLNLDSSNLQLKLLFIQLLTYQNKASEEGAELLAECSIAIKEKNLPDEKYALLYISLLYNYQHYETIRDFANDFLEHKNHQITDKDLQDILYSWT